uniref:Nuclear inhibitor of protein phosphatase 1 n=1 Tax=Sphaeramia orbicularis TaxID=375764 RepID=A0A672YUS9_9TELE
FRCLSAELNQFVAGKPPAGLHLDVVKGDKLVEKLIIDEKKYYLFGRNPDVCDFTVDHQSCSRIHSALVYHKRLRRVFIIDLNSTHGTFLGRIRLEPHKPQQVPLDSTMSFGASTRVYILREKPQSQGCAVPGEMKTGKDEELKGLLGLPEAEMELDNLTEFNTAHNKRLSTLTIEEGDLDIHRPKRRRRRRRRSSRVSFSDEEEVINPEDVDPFVGRFRNLIQAAVVPVKKHDITSSLGLDAAVWRRPSPSVSGSLYGDLPLTGPGGSTPPTPPQAAASITGPLPLKLPKVNVSPTSTQTPVTLNRGPAPGSCTVEPLDEPHKKKYAKEAWPEKKPTFSLLI